MNKQLKDKNIVLVGTFFLASFDKFFFIKNEIFSEEEIQETSVFNHDLVLLNTETIQVLINANQLIISELDPKTDNNKIVEISKKIYKYGKSISITAAGINLNWYFLGTKDDVSDFSRKNFYIENSSLLSRFFDDKESMYGFYASSDFLKSRLKLDIKPATAKSPDVVEELNLLIFNFNYHFELNKDLSLPTVLEDYHEYINHSTEIISIYKL
jgi:hypothetical protein